MFKLTDVCVPYDINYTNYSFTQYDTYLMVTMTIHKCHDKICSVNNCHDKTYPNM